MVMWVKFASTDPHLPIEMWCYHRARAKRGRRGSDAHAAPHRDGNWSICREKDRKRLCVFRAGGIILLLLRSLLLFMLDGWSFCPEQNHPANLICMLIVNHFDCSEPDRNWQFKQFCDAATLRWFRAVLKHSRDTVCDAHFSCIKHESRMWSVWEQA